MIYPAQHGVPSQKDTIRYAYVGGDDEQTAHLRCPTMHSVSAKAGSRVALTPNDALQRVSFALLRTLSPLKFPPCSVPTSSVLIIVMVQGKTKNLQKSTGNSRAAKKAAANPKKGKRAIAPKKEALVKQAKMHQVRHIQHKP